MKASWSRPLLSTAATTSEKHFTHRTWPWQIAIHPVKRVSVFYDLPGYSYSHDNPVYHEGFLLAWSFLILWGETLIYLLWCTLSCDIYLLRINPTVAVPHQQEAVIPCRLKHILYFSLWQRWNWAKLAWNASAPSWERPINERELGVT